MNTITIECDVTEFSVIPDEKYEKVIFCLNKKSVVISFADDNDKILTQSEIDKNDAIYLARLILLKYNINLE